MAELHHDAAKSPAVPKEFGGKGIVWNQAGDNIIASGETLAECEKNVSETDETEPRFEKVPRPGVRIIGAAR